MKKALSDYRHDLQNRVYPGGWTISRPFAAFVLLIVVGFLPLSLLVYGMLYALETPENRVHWRKVPRVFWVMFLYVVRGGRDEDMVGLD